MPEWRTSGLGSGNMRLVGQHQAVIVANIIQVLEGTDHVLKKGRTCMALEYGRSLSCNDEEVLGITCCYYASLV